MYLEYQRPVSSWGHNFLLLRDWQSGEQLIRWYFCFRKFENRKVQFWIEVRDITQSYYFFLDKRDGDGIFHHEGSILTTPRKNPTIANRSPCQPWIFHACDTRFHRWLNFRHFDETASWLDSKVIFLAASYGESWWNPGILYRSYEIWVNICKI